MDEQQGCVWLWTGAGWGEPPDSPHVCPPGQACQPPQSPGTRIGQEVSTPCQPV